MSYETESFKRQKLIISENKNQNDIDKLVRLDSTSKPDQYIKNIKTINLVKGYNFTFGVITTPFNERVSILQGVVVAPIEPVNQSGVGG